jgi:hypothetical protein
MLHDHDEKTYPVPVPGRPNAGPKANSKQAMCVSAIAVILTL